MQVEQYYSDDYAGLNTGNLKFYYGYEVEDPLTEEWCFQVKQDDREIYRATRSKIEESANNWQLDTPKDYLIVGIGMWLFLTFYN